MRSTASPPTGRSPPSISTCSIARSRAETQGFAGNTRLPTGVTTRSDGCTQTSRPYFDGSGTPQCTTYSYDTLGRVVSATKPDGSVAPTAYHGLSVTETNAMGQTRTVVKNSQGKVVSITDALSKTMTYAYDAVGNLVATTDAVGNVVTATYDQRGRKTASSDPDLGIWTYEYNTLDQVVKQTDAKNQMTRSPTTSSAEWCSGSSPT